MSAQPSDASSGRDGKLLHSLIIEHYDKLHKLAAKQMAGEGSCQTLDTTGLVNEAVARMLKAAGPVDFKHVGQFLATAKKIMKHVLIDRARHKQTVKGGGGHKAGALDIDPAGKNHPVLDLLIVQEEFQRLTKEDPEAARVVELRCQGYAIDEIAQQLNLSRSTTYGLWNWGRAWLAKAFFTAASDLDSR
jgi:RNA polymerase sigma factor (TIGR02999 family)